MYIFAETTLFMLVLKNSVVFIRLNEIENNYNYKKETQYEIYKFLSVKVQKKHDEKCAEKFVRSYSLNVRPVFRLTNQNLGSLYVQ